MLTDSRVAAFKAPAQGQKEYPDTKVTGLRLRVGSGGTKTWIFRARTGQQTINKKLGTYPGLNLADARIAALKLISAIARGGSAEAIERTFGAVASHWIEKVAKPKNDSWRNQARRLELHVLPKWGDRKIVDIRRADVRDLIESIEGDVLPNHVLTVVKTVFRFALSRDWIDFSPADGIRKPKPGLERDRVLSMPEISRIWSAAELLGYPFGPYIQLLMLSGQRRTETASVRWSDLDLGEGQWTIPAANTKGDRTHLVPLAQRAIAVLKTLPRLGVYVFTTDGRTHFSGYAKVKSRLDKFIAAAGGPLEPWRLHDLRRSAATHMVRLGIPEEVVSRILNHARQGVTARVYALHSYAPEKRRALEAWAAEIGHASDGVPADIEEGVGPWITNSHVRGDT